MLNKLKTLFVAVTLSTALIGCNIYECLPIKKPTDKVEICHKTGNGFKLLNISTMSGQSHINHGDFLAPVGAKKNSDCIIPPVEDTTTIPVDTTPGAGDNDGESIIDLPGDIEVPQICIDNPTLIECLL